MIMLKVENYLSVFWLRTVKENNWENVEKEFGISEFE